VSEGASTVSVSAVGRLIPAVVCVAAVGVAIFAFLITRHVGALVPPLVFLAAVATMAWTPAGRSLVTRLGLGLVAVGAAMAITVTIFIEGGRNPNSLMFGAMFLVGAVAVTLIGPSGLIKPAAALDWFPILAVVAAVAMTAVVYLQSRSLSSLALATLFMGGSILILLAARAEGTQRFGLGLAAVAFAVALIYFTVISGAGVAAVVLGVLVLVSAGQLLGAGVRPAGDRPV